jgi:hypothetical protein
MSVKVVKSADIVADTVPDLQPDPPEMIPSIHVFVGAEKFNLLNF